MSVVRVLLAALLFSALTACNSDDGAGSSGAPSGFRNLGKRGDSNVGSQGAAVSLR
jgi:hypothetical protein